jgi:hypothetical protein
MGKQQGVLLQLDAWLWAQRFAVKSKELNISIIIIINILRDGRVM